MLILFYVNRSSLKHLRLRRTGYLQLHNIKCDNLRDLLPFVQFKKREKHPRRSFTFSKVAGQKPATLLKLTLLHGCFSRFLNCTKW